MNAKKLILLTLTLASVGLAGCDESPAVVLAPSATTLADVKPKAASAATYQIAKKGSKVDFSMDAPKEKIIGEVADASSGELQILLSDISKTTGHMYVDIGGIVLYRQMIADDGTKGEKKKQDIQNEHARNWLEIGPCEKAEDKTKCAADVKKNSNVEFVISKVEVSDKDVSAMKGDVRKVKAKVTGTFLLHQHKTEKTADVEITFKMKGAKAESVQVKTVKPFSIGLAEHDVRPRMFFGKLAEKSLDVLAPKVAKAAEVGIDFTAAAAQAPSK